jgi:carbon-monoxide dehydrogenase iron sulfur subunit
MVMENQKLDSKKLNRILIREEYCMGCRICEVRCVVQHSKSKDIIKVYKGEGTRPLSRMIVEEKGHISFALQCRHCQDAPCIEACITGAMYRDKKTGAVLCDEAKCVGCWMCIMVCPFGVISRDVAGKRIASKCDLCMGEEVPVCVKNCPNEAIVCQEKK